MASKDDELLKQLENKHPDYDEWSPEWERYRDVLGDMLIDKRKYLPKNAFEPESEYEFRVNVSQFIPESGLAIEKVIGALYDQKPNREMPGQESVFKDFLENADRKGNSWNDVVESICHTLIGYGTTRVLINVPQIQSDMETLGEEKTKVVTRGTEQKKNIRPFVINYSPLAITDWEVDEFGQPIWIRIREESFKRVDDNRLSPAVKHVKFIEYDSENVRWWIFKESKRSDFELADSGSGVHGFGIVPMVVCNVREIKGMIGNSFVRYSSRADVQKTQAESDQAYDTYLHAHPVLKIWTQAELSEVGIGTNSFIKLNPGMGGIKEDAAYVEVPNSAFEALRRVIEDKRTQIYRQSNTDPMGQTTGENNVFQASGVARAWSFGTSEARILSKVADKMEQVEARVLEIVARAHERKAQALDPEEKVFKGSIQYPEEFDMSATQTLIEESERIAQQINSPTLIRILHKRIAASKIGDATSKTLKSVHDEIEKNPLMGTMAGAGTEGGSFQMPTISGDDGDDNSDGDRGQDGNV
jgi:hypothetical protein